MGILWLFDYFEKIKSMVCVCKQVSCDFKQCAFNIKWYFSFVCLFVCFCRLYSLLYSDFNLSILKSALFPHGSTENPEIIAYKPSEYITNRISLCTRHAVSKKVHYGWVHIYAGPEVLQIIFLFSGNYAQYFFEGNLQIL